jgi:tetratricopeptide (TPR) repeat protein
LSAPATNPAIRKISAAAQQLRNGRRAEAVLVYEEIAATAGDNVAVNLELGHLCNELGVPDRAAMHYAVAVEQEPDNANYLGYLAVAYQNEGRHEQALPLFERARELDPNIVEVLHGLGVHYLNRSDFRQAVEYLERARQLRPSDASVLTNLATALSNLNEHETALQHAEKALKLDPAQPNTHYAVGKVLTEMGRTDDAVRHFEKTIRQHKTFGGAYDLLARMKKFSSADSAFMAKTEKVLDLGMSARDRIGVHYALGKMYDDCNEWDRAFAHFSHGNLLKKKPFDLKRERRIFPQMRKVYDAASIARYRDLGHSTAQPVFIIGMPRSGTTLMERMIASHPRGAAAGELTEIPRIAEHVSPVDEPRRYAARTKANLTSGTLHRYAEEYLHVLKQGREDAERIVDKLPFNYYHLGLISVMFPNASIIHAIRNPLDTCLSCYFQNFTTVRWANDFESIAAFYRLYRDMMDYWKRVLPEGKIVDIVYEQLTDDPETQGRRLLEGCGLDWDSSSLEFHREEGVVKTASLWQVRQPIYSSSIRRWENYAPHIGELAKALADYLQDDRDLLGRHGIEIPAAGGRGWARKLFG